MKPLGVTMMKPLGASSGDPQTSQAFLRSCQAESDPPTSQPSGSHQPDLVASMSLQFRELRDHIDSRWDEMLRACTRSSQQPTCQVPEESLQNLCEVALQRHIDSCWDELLRTFKNALRQPTIPEETLQQFCNTFAEIVSEVKSLRHQTSSLEERLTWHSATQLTEQATGGIREAAAPTFFGRAISPGRSSDETGWQMRLEARLIHMQQSHSARLEEVLQQCQHLHVCLEEQLTVAVPPVVALPLPLQLQKHQVPPASNDPIEYPAVTRHEADHDAAKIPAWLLPDERDPPVLQSKNFAKTATQDVSGLMQTLGWSEDAGERICDTVVVEDVGIIRCRVYLQWMSTALVAVNAIFMGIAAEAGLACAIQKEPHPEWARIGDIVFFFLFMCELLIRLALDKWKFCSGPDVGWNAADVVTTLLMGLEVAFSIGGNASFIRAMRLLRVVRALRALEVFRSLRVARLMFASLYTIVCPLACALAFLLFILYLASLGVSQAVEQYISQDGGSEDLLELYGSLWATMFTFFMAIVGGAEWRQLLRPLHAISGVLVFLFVLVEVFAIFGITNLLTASIVEFVIRSSQTHERLAMRASMVEQRSAVNGLRQELITLPSGPNGLMDRRAAAKMLKGEGKHHLENMGVELQTALGLLKMLDTEDTGYIHVDEFLCSLSQLQAENMSVHMTTTIYESKKILQSIAALRRSMEESWFQAAMGRVGTLQSAHGAASGTSGWVSG